MYMLFVYDCDDSVIMCQWPASVASCFGLEGIHEQNAPKQSIRYSISIIN